MKRILLVLSVPFLTWLIIRTGTDMTVFYGHAIITRMIMFGTLFLTFFVATFAVTGQGRPVTPLPALLLLILLAAICHFSPAVQLFLGFLALLGAVPDLVAWVVSLLFPGAMGDALFWLLGAGLCIVFAFLPAEALVNRIPAEKHARA